MIKTVRKEEAVHAFCGVLLLLSGVLSDDLSLRRPIACVSRSFRLNRAPRGASVTLYDAAAGSGRPPAVFVLPI